MVSIALDVTVLLYSRLLCWPTRLMDGDSYIVICSAGSGEEVAKLDSDDFAAVVEGHGTSSVRALKKFLAHRLQISRFRQRLLNQDTGELLQDDMILSPRMNIQLVKLEFLPSDGRREEEFMNACAEGLLDEVERILQGPQDPNLSGDNAPLHLAAKHGHLEVVGLLLESGSDKEKALSNGATALSLAAMNGHLEVVRLLLESGADKDRLAFEGATALYLAAWSGRIEIVRLLVDSDADKEKMTIDGLTALHVAAVSGEFEVVRLLLESGADKEKPTSDGETALQFAVEGEHDDVVHLLQTFSPFKKQRCSSNLCESVCKLHAHDVKMLGDCQNRLFSGF